MWARLNNFDWRLEFSRSHSFPIIVRVHRGNILFPNRVFHLLNNYLFNSWQNEKGRLFANSRQEAREQHGERNCVEQVYNAEAEHEGWFFEEVEQGRVNEFFGADEAVEYWNGKK